MSGWGREEEESPARKKEETDHEAQEIQPPSPILTGFCPVSAQVVPGRVHHRAPDPPPKAQEPQPPATPRTAESAYQEPGFGPLLGGPGRQEEGRVEEGPEMERREENQEVKPLEEAPSPLFEPLSPRFEPSEEHYTTDDPVEEGQEKPPDQEDLEKSTKPPAPEGSQNSDDHSGQSGTSDKRGRRKMSRIGKQEGGPPGSYPGLPGRRS